MLLLQFLSTPLPNKKPNAKIKAMVVREISSMKKKREYVCRTLLYTVLVPLSANPIFVPENICFVREEDLTFPKGDRS
jgi:hypothetical protein